MPGPARRADSERGEAALGRGCWIGTEDWTEPGREEVGPGRGEVESGRERGRQESRRVPGRREPRGRVRPVDPGALPRRREPRGQTASSPKACIGLAGAMELELPLFPF